MMFFVFFFKQKTAYEMRISDWSSDVCSSDLAKQAVHAAHCHRVVGDDQVAGAGIADHLIEQIAEALDIGVIKWRINFVENADGGGVGEEQPEYERDGSQGLLAA